MQLVHRFYDLHTGGAEVVIHNLVRALPEHSHILAFNRHRESWLSAELSRLPQVRLVQMDGMDIQPFLKRYPADRIIFHFYPPMSAADFATLTPEQARCAFLYSHWFEGIPHVPSVFNYIFPSRFGAEVGGKAVPEEQRQVVLNPVADHFFETVRRPAGMFSIGRHSRPEAIKFSPDFFSVMESIPLNLQVKVLGFYPPLAESLSKRLATVRHDYWLMPANSLKVPSFLSELDVFVYKTNDTIAETAPMVILEAMAAGLPVVAEAKGGIIEFIKHGETGFLCYSNDDYAEYVVRLYHDEPLRSDISRRARAWARDVASLTNYRENIRAALRLTVT